MYLHFLIFIQPVMPKCITTCGGFDIVIPKIFALLASTDDFVALHRLLELNGACTRLCRRQYRHFAPVRSPVFCPQDVFPDEVHDARDFCEFGHVVLLLKKSPEVKGNVFTVS